MITELLFLLIFSLLPLTFILKYIVCARKEVTRQFLDNFQLANLQPETEIVAIDPNYCRPTEVKAKA